MAEASLLAQLESASFSQIVATAEGIGASRGEPMVIVLYRNWIATHASGEANLYAAWFNLGVEYAHGGQPHEAILAYRTVLALKPDFAPAAINLGLLLEQAGQPEAALQAWDRALQPDASRTALLNQRARLMEQRGALADAEATLRRSLLTDPRQPDAVQHWVHIRQKMCLWPALDETNPGLRRDELLSQCGPLAVLALTDRIAAQRAVAANWIARKTSATPTRLSPEQGYRHDRIRLPGLLQQEAKIDRSRRAIRFQRQCRTIRQDRLVRLAAMCVFHAEIEPGGVEIALPARMRGDPVPVEGNDGRLTAAGADAFGGSDDLTERGAFKLRQKRGLGHDALRFSLAHLSRRPLNSRLPTVG